MCIRDRDNTGAEIQTSLIEAVKAHPNITIFTDHYAVEIITQHHLGTVSYTHLDVYKRQHRDRPH